MTAEVIAFPGQTTAPGLASDILQSAIDANLDTAIVIGCDQDGELWFSGNKSDAAELLFLIEMAKHKLMEMVS